MYDPVFSRPLSIVQISDDCALAASRALVLRNAGCTVEILSSRGAVLPQVLHCDLLLLCQTLRFPVAAGIVLAAAAGPHPPGNLRIAWAQEANAGVFDNVLYAPVFPKALVAAVTLAAAVRRGGPEWKQQLPC